MLFRSYHSFRVDVGTGSGKALASQLVSISTDPTFIGYPFGLIQADAFARISNHEAELTATRLKVLAGKDWQKIEPFLQANNAHDILDSIG